MDSLDIKLHWGLSDAQLSEIYQTAKKEGVLSLVAFDGDIDEKGFMLFAKDVAVFGSGFDDQGRPLGFFYLTSFEGATARLHFCFFQAGRAQRHLLGRQVMGWCFKTFRFESLIGIVPVINRGACQYAREVGGKEMGVIPGICWIDRLKRAVSGVQFIFTKGDSDYGRNV